MRNRLSRPGKRPPLKFTSTLGGSACYCHFTEEESKVRAEGPVQGPRVGEGLLCLEPLKGFRWNGSRLPLW